MSESIADFQLPIADWNAVARQLLKIRIEKSAIGNRQLEMRKANRQSQVVGVLG